MLFFAIGRIYFLIYNIDLWIDSGIYEMLKTFIYSLYLDTSVASYYMIIPYFFININLWIGDKKWLKNIHKIYMMIFIIISMGLILSEPPLFAEWKIKTNYKALWHVMMNPSEMFRISTNFILVIFTIIFFLWIYFSYKIINRKIFTIKGKVRKNWYLRIAFPLIFPFLLLGGIRGGVNPIPISQSDVYFSNNNVLNLATVNTVWNLGQSYFANRFYLDNNPYTKIEEKEAIERTKKLLFVEENGERTQVLNSETPNVIFIIMESWSADFIEKLEGYKGIAPNFNRLTNEGLLFKKCVASATLSDRAMASIFSSFPTQPETSIANTYSKYIKLPSIGKTFKSKGYNTSFVFGGDLAYGNIGTYLRDGGIDNITEEKHFKKMNIDLSKEGIVGRLGYQDEVTFDYLYKSLETKKEPFFAGFFSLSTHSPYDMPKEGIPNFDFKRDNEYMKSGYYADIYLGKFIDKIKEKDWYKNTLVVIMADHSHGTPSPYNYRGWKYHHIPMLWLGGALKENYKGKLYDKFTNQENISKSLFNQLGWYSEAKKYKWSRDMFNSNYKNFAYLAFSNGYGMITPKGGVSYDYISNKEVYSKWKEDITKEEKEDLRKNNLAFLRCLFQEFIDIDNIKK